MSAILIQLKEKAKTFSRTRKDEFFYSLCNSPCSILDVGVFPESKADKNIATNHFLHQFRYPAESYTGLGIEGMDKMGELYPHLKFVEYDGRIFPFKDKEFEWTYSNAVIEHVGEYEAQLLFVKEMARVSKNVFFTTPNKYFPIDAHTMVFFLHWNDDMFIRYRTKRNKWMPKESLCLLSYADLKKMLKEANVKNYKIIKNRFFGITMTFTVIITNN